MFRPLHSLGALHKCFEFGPSKVSASGKGSASGRTADSCFGQLAQCHQRQFLKGQAFKSFEGSIA
ncbi:hypothetical protein StoSoilB22_16500 [Arthrobacter sp. StoSoilB22]|nr:hypothetical protein StoSoilB22_16500 [Arthrobacter sp. StoSoilB22]